MKKLVFSVLICLNVLYSPLWAQIPSNGLVAWYPFNGNANDESGNGNHGVVNGATLTADRFGNLSSAYDFDGAGSYVGLPQIAATGNISRSLACWIKTDLAIPQALISTGNAFQFGGCFNLVIKYPFQGMDIPGVGLMGAVNDCYNSNASSVSTLNWHFIATTYEAGLLKIFLDGVEQPSCALNFNTNGQTNFIGKSNDPLYEAFFNGLIDDVLVYSRALSLSEIQQLYQDQTGQVQQPLTCNITAPTTTLCEGESVTLSVNTTGGSVATSQLPANLQQGLVAYYPFNGNANDESGNGNNGVVNGAVLTADRLGNTNSAYSFNGLNNFIEIMDEILPSQFGDFSLGYWYLRTTVTESAESVISNRSSNGYKMVSNFAMNSNTNGGVQAAMCNYENNDCRVSSASNSQSPSNSLWNHVFINFEASAGKLYLSVNGNLMDSVGLSVNNWPVYSNVVSTYIGGAPNVFGDEQFFNGKIDDVFIYNRIMSPSEIQQLYTAQSYAWSNNETTPTITVSPTANTTYSCTVTQGNQTCTASVDITVNPTITNTISATIVEGETYTLGTQTLTTAGTYTEVFTSAAGCDSTVTLTLSLEPPSITCSIQMTSSSLCDLTNVQAAVEVSGLINQQNLLGSLAGFVGPFVFNGHTYYYSTETYTWEAAYAQSLSISGSHMATISSQAENDFLYQLSPGSIMFFGWTDRNNEGNWSWVNGEQVVYTNWCSGEPNGSIFENYGHFLCGNGTWNDTNSPNTIQYLLEFDGLYEQSISPQYNWSSGSTASFTNFSATSSEWLSVQVTNGNQFCEDSVFIPLNQSVQNNISATIIEGESYTLGTQTLTTAGTYTEVFTSAAGCDSTVTLTLVVEPLLTCEITAPTTTLCEGESVTLSVNTTGGAGASSQLPSNLQQGLVAYYPFNGNANDESGNGNNGVVNGATLTADRFGYAGSAYSFDGVNDFITFPSSSSLNIPSYNGLSFSFWMNVDLTGNVRIMHFYNSFNDLSIHHSALGAIHCINYLSNGIGANILHEAQAPSNQWVNFIWSMDFSNNQSEIYLNGELQSVQMVNDPLLNSDMIFEIGSGTYWPLNGSIDNLLVFNRALSPSEIQQLHAAQSYAWSNNASTPTINVTPTANTTYSCTVTQGNQTCTASVDITVTPAITNAISATIIEGQSYTLGTQTLTSAGTYTEVFTSAAGCDSTVTLTLSVEPLLTCEITAPATSLCEGESVMLSVSTTGGAGASTQLPTNLQQGLVAYYPFNGNANDESGNGNDGVVNGATLTSDRFGNIGNAYDFDGMDDFINCGIWNLGPSEFTISAWVNETEVNTNPSFVVSKFDGISLPFPDNNILRSWILYRHSGNEANRFVFEMSQDGVLTDNLYFNEIGQVNVWKNIAVTFNQGEVRCFVNGVIDTTFSIPFSTVFQSDVPVFIGISAKDYFPEPMSDAWFSGEIDDLIFHNRALSLSEIQQLYTAQSYAWSTNETTPNITVTPTQNTTYSCTVTQGNQTCTASVDITVNPNITNAISATIFEGQSYTLGTQTLTTAGTFTEIFTSAAGCDSTVTLTLSVEPLLTCSITAPTTTLCDGESVTLSVNTTGGAGSSSLLPANLQQGLVAYYPFNGNANDESGNGNNGNVNGATLTADRFGYFEKAYNFDGNDWISLGDKDDLELTANFTISSWFFSQSNGVFNSILSKASCNEPLIQGYIVGLQDFNFGGSESKVHFQAYPYMSDAADILPNAAGIIQEGIWYNFIVVYNKEINNLKYYLNGDIIVDDFFDITISNTSLEAFIGRHINQTTGFCIESGFVGELDDIAIFNRALSPSEIQQLYTTQSYAWSNNATTPTITVTPTANTTYTCTVTQGNQTCTDSITITVNPLLTWYADADADGFGNPDDVVQDCNQPQGYTADNSDCNDVDSSTYPNAEEICFDQIDNNCNGTVDENCAIFGCINPNACNFNPAANTDDGSCILPQPEVCNNLDDNCNNQTDEGLSFVNYYNDNDGDGQGTGTAINACASPGTSYVTTTGDCNDNNNAINSNATEICDAIDNDCDGLINEGLMPADINAIPVNTALYPTCTSGNLFSANLTNGTNTAVINGNGPDLWYRLTAQHNTLRASLSAAAGVNGLGIYQDMGGCLMLMTEENEVTTGNQILLTDALQVGATYYIAVHQIATPTNTSAKICFNHFVPSTCDHVYSGNTGVYSNVCLSFKAQFRANASNYIFNVLSAAQNGSNLNIIPWSYTTPTASSIVTRLGTLLPANMSASNIVYTLNIPVTYGLYDAANNLTLLTANATSTCTVTLQPETGVTLRTTDRCPNIKAINQSIATDRSICGTLRYEWEFTQTAPTLQSPVIVLGGLNSTALFLNTVPGMGNGKTYNVRVRPIHTTGEAGNYGAVQCMKTTGAGMILENHPSSAGAELPLLSLRAGGEMVSLFPNPTVDGQVNLLWKESQEGSKVLVLRDVQGRIVWKQKVVLEGNLLEIDWKTLDTGIYLLEVDGQMMRVVKG